MHRGKSSDTNRKIPEKPWKKTRKKPTAGLILKAPSSIRKINIIRIDKGGDRGRLFLLSFQAFFLPLYHFCSLSFPFKYSPPKLGGL